MFEDKKSQDVKRSHSAPAINTCHDFEHGPRRR